MGYQFYYNTVGFYHNAVQYKMILLSALWWLKSNINLDFELTKDTHLSRSHSDPVGTLMEDFVQNWLLMDGAFWFININCFRLHPCLHQTIFSNLRWIQKSGHADFLTITVGMDTEPDTVTAFSDDTVTWDPFH